MTPRPRHHPGHRPDGPQNAPQGPLSSPHTVSGMHGTLTAIDTALADPDPAVCATCSGSLAESPSDDFCSEPCQDTWLTGRSTSAPMDHQTGPDDQIPETTPTRALGWLGPPPPGTVLRPGHEVLDEVAAFVARHNVFPDEHCVPTLTLWYAHTHATDRFYITPRLVLDSAEPGSGKTRVLEVAAHLVAAPEMTISATPAALFRLVAAGPITILFDEVDALFSQNSGSTEDLRALLNAGYKAGATVARCVGDAKTMKVERFPVFAPAALAGIAGAMPDTITTRAITIHMRRRRTDQTVAQFRLRAVTREATPIREALAAWIATVAEQLASAEPVMPDHVTDRPAEIWEPLLAIADAAGGHWPHTARAACTHFVLDSGPEVRSTGIRLLADLRSVFGRHQADRLPTTTLLTDLAELEDSDWTDLDGRALDARRLARELARYSVRVQGFKHHNGKTIKGYLTYPTDKQVGLTDAWARYLPPDTPSQVGNCGNHGNRAGQTVTDDRPVTDPSVTTPHPETP
ncbi:MAG: DUF3631 domain-containing protein [Pseudonocardia sp.]